MLLLIFAFSSPALALEKTATFWRYGKDRYKRPSLTERLEVPLGAPPISFLAEQSHYKDWHSHRKKKIHFIVEKTTYATIPILSFHKIGNEDRFALTPDRFRILLQYLNKNGWHMISDKQYFEGDFSRVPIGSKPIVMGADDAGYGNLMYKTHGNKGKGRIKRRLGKPLIEENTLVGLLEKYAKREEGKINFTFYISFDAIPFRQLGGARNPGFPYPSIPIVKEKIKYLARYFHLGLHTLSHTYVYEQTSDEFIKDLLDGWELLNEYAEGKALKPLVLAFPYGLSTLTPSLRQALSSFRYRGIPLRGAFDLDNVLAEASPTLAKKFDVSRFNADNDHWEELMEVLYSINPVPIPIRRLLVWETESKRLPPPYVFSGLKRSDELWILVRN